MSMNPSVSTVRALALHLVRHAARVLPHARAAWAAAMEREVGHIDSDGAALRWALGCALTSYAERIEAMNLLESRYLRWLLACVIAAQAANTFLDPALTLAWHRQWLGVAQFLGGFTPGDDYRRFIPLMDVVPGWIVALRFAASLLFAGAAWRLLLRRSVAFSLFGTALMLALLTWLYEKRIPAYDALFTVPQQLVDYATFGVCFVTGLALLRIARTATASVRKS